MIKTKVCKNCGNEKDVFEFSKHGGFKNGHNSRCKTCKNLSSKIYYVENSKKILERQKKFMRRQLLKKYGISEECYNNMLEEQNCGCAICGNKDNRRRLAVDHDHKTGKVRELLCDNCNWIIGLSKDNSDILRNAANYIDKHGKHPNG